MKYDVYVSITITPQPDEQGAAPPGMLGFSRRLTLEGERFSDIGFRVDALSDAIDEVLDQPGKGRGHGDDDGYSGVGEVSRSRGQG